MKGIRFYADLPGTEWDLDTPHPIPGDLTRLRRLRANTNVARLRALGAKGAHVNCIALMLGDEFRNDYRHGQECLSSVFSHPDSGVAVGGVSFEYLRKCRRIPESVARQLHPQLFARLDTD